MNWVQAWQEFSIKNRLYQRLLALAFIGILSLVGTLAIHISVNAAQPSAVLVANSYNFNSRGLGVRRKGSASLEKISNGRTQLQAFQDIILVEGDNKSWAALVHLFSQKPQQHGGFIMRTLKSATPSQYWFSCRAQGKLLMAWRKGGKDRSCSNGLKLTRRDGLTKSFLKSNSIKTTKDNKSFVIAQALDEITIVPGSEPTLIQASDSETGIILQVLQGSIQVTSTSIPGSKLVQKYQQYSYPQDQTIPFNADSAMQSTEVKEFLQDENWIRPDTPKPISDAIKNQLQSYRNSMPTVGDSRPVEVDSKLLKATIYLNSPETILKLAYRNTPQSFSNFVASNNAAIVTSGTFAFGKDWQMISEGKQVAGTFRFTTGTVLGIRRGNQPEMVTLKKEGLPNWDDYWFAIAAGPRLLKAGQILPWQPSEEGFADPKITNTQREEGRSAIGFSADRTRLYYVLFKQNVSLRRAAELMKQIGCAEAMNLEGGATRSFAHNGKILEPGGRPQTHVLVVYDVNRPAPDFLKQAWKVFQRA